MKANQNIPLPTPPPSLRTVYMFGFIEKIKCDEKIQELRDIFRWKCDGFFPYSEHCFRQFEQHLFLKTFKLQMLRENTYHTMDSRTFREKYGKTLKKFQWVCFECCPSCQKQCSQVFYLRPHFHIKFHRNSTPFC